MNVSHVFSLPMYNPAVGFAQITLLNRRKIGSCRLPIWSSLLVLIKKWNKREYEERIYKGIKGRSVFKQGWVSEAKTQAMKLGKIAANTDVCQLVDPRSQEDL